MHPTAPPPSPSHTTSRESGPGPLMRARAHATCDPLWTGPTWAFSFFPHFHVTLSILVNVIRILYTITRCLTMRAFRVLSSPSLMRLCYARLHMPPSRGGSLAHYHVVAISSPRFLLGNRRPGSEPDEQKKSICSIFKPQALNLRVERFLNYYFLQSPFSERFKQKQAHKKNCRVWLSGTVLLLPGSGLGLGLGCSASTSQSTI